MPPHHQGQLSSIALRGAVPGHPSAKDNKGRVPLSNHHVLGVDFPMLITPEPALPHCLGEGLASSFVPMPSEPAILHVTGKGQGSPHQGHLVVTWVTDINPDPFCCRAVDPNIALGGSTDQDISVPWLLTSGCSPPPWRLPFHLFS